jgi:hypothetical protein
MSSNSAKERSATLKALEDKRTKFKRLIKHYVSEHTKIDAIDFFYSTPNTVYLHNLPEAPGPTFDFNLAKTTKSNAIHNLLDPERLGIAVHSMGATAVSVFQGETDWPGTMHDHNPVKVAVA